MREKSGYTLLEVSIATAILTIVSLLGFIVLRSSTDSANLSRAQGGVQQNLRSVMTSVATEVRSAYTERTVDSLVAPEDAEAITVSDEGRSITFMVPEPDGTHPIPQPSAPITIRYENEDANQNGVLDAGEDADGDGALTRRLVRVQGPDTRTIGASNDISNVQFALLPNREEGDDRLTTLQITLESNRRFGPGNERTVRAELESSIHLEN